MSDKKPYWAKWKTIDSKGNREYHESKPWVYMGFWLSNYRWKIYGSSGNIAGWQNSVSKAV